MMPRVTTHQQGDISDQTPLLTKRGDEARLRNEAQLLLDDIKTLNLQISEKEHLIEAQKKIVAHRCIEKNKRKKINITDPILEQASKALNAYEFIRIDFSNPPEIYKNLAPDDKYEILKKQFEMRQLKKEIDGLKCTLFEKVKKAAPEKGYYFFEDYAKQAELNLQSNQPVELLKGSDREQLWHSALEYKRQSLQNKLIENISFAEAEAIFNSPFLSNTTALEFADLLWEKNPEFIMPLLHGRAYLLGRGKLLFKKIEKLITDDYTLNIYRNALKKPETDPLNSYDLAKISDTFLVDFTGPARRAVHPIIDLNVKNETSRVFSDENVMTDTFLGGIRNIGSHIFESRTAIKEFFNSSTDFSRKQKREALDLEEKKLNFLINHAEEEEKKLSLTHVTNKEEQEKIIKKLKKLRAEKEALKAKKKAMELQEESEGKERFFYDNWFDNFWLWRKKKTFFHIINFSALILSMFGNIGFLKVILTKLVELSGKIVTLSMASNIALAVKFAAPIGMLIFGGLGTLRWLWFLGETAIKRHTLDKELAKVNKQLKELSDDTQEKQELEQRKKELQQKLSENSHELLRQSFYLLSYLALLTGSILSLGGAIATAVAAAPAVITALSIASASVLIVASVFMTAATTWRIFRETVEYMTGKAYENVGLPLWAKAAAGLTAGFATTCVGVVSGLFLGLSIAFPAAAIPLAIAGAVITGLTFLAAPLLAVVSGYACASYMAPKKTNLSYELPAVQKPVSLSVENTSINVLPPSQTPQQTQAQPKKEETPPFHDRKSSMISTYSNTSTNDLTQLEEERNKIKRSQSTYGLHAHSSFFGGTITRNSHSIDLPAPPSILQTTTEESPDINRPLSPGNHGIQ